MTNAEVESELLAQMRAQHKKAQEEYDAWFKRITAQMNVENVNMSGAQAVPQEEIDKRWREQAHLAVNMCNSYYSSERTVRIKPKKWWQWWR
jgi:hypothetical protein